jgi:hypothetical protein
MKKILILVSLFTFNAFAKMPDLIIKSQITHGHSEKILKKIKTFMVNNNLGDFTQGKIDKRLVVNESILANHFDHNSKEIVDKISGFLPFDISNTMVEIAIEGISYKLKNLSLHLKTDGDNYKAEFRATGACAALDKLTLTLKVPMGDDFYLPTYAPSVQSPMLLIGHMSKEECLSSESIDTNDSRKPLAFDVDLSATINDKSMALAILETSFTKVKDLVDNKRDQIRIVGLNKKNLHVDDVVVEYGPKEIIFFGEKVEDFILDNKASYIGLILDQFSKMIGQGHLDKVVEVLSEVQIDREYWIANADFQSYLSIDRLQAGSGENEFVAFLNGGFCLTPDFKLMGKNCLNTDPLYYEEEDDAISTEKVLSELDQIMKKNGATVLASASESYVNSIINLTFKAGYWASEFNTSELEIGPEGAFVKFNKAGTRAKFYLQIKYKAKKIHKLIVGAKKIDMLIPIISEVSFKTIIKNGIPVLQFIVESIDTSKETLWYGDKYMSSTFHKVKRFKKIIRNKFLLPEVKKYIGKSALDLPLPEVRGLDLENATIYIDGQGRANLML